MKKKTLFFTLIIALLLVPGVILAADTDVTEVSTAEELLSAVSSNGTVKLMDNIDLDKKIEILEGTTVILDLNGKTLDLLTDEEYQLNHNTVYYAIAVKGDLTITGNGTLNVNGTYGFTTGSKSGNITIENGTFNGSETAVYLIADYGGNVIINDGTFNALYYTVNGVDGWSKNPVQINGGTFNTAVKADDPEDQNVIAGNVLAKAGTFNRVIRGENIASDADITIKLDADMNIANLWRANDASETIVIPSNSKVTIDLNGHNITGSNKLFDVKGAELVVTGNGTIKEAQPDLAPIHISGDSAAKTTVKVGKDVTLEGWSGIMVAKNAKDAKGVDVTFAGKINTKPDANNGLGGGIYINGYVTDIDIVNVTVESTAVIDALACAIYAGGYGNWDINGATLKGVEAAIGVKSGSFEIKNAKLTATGPDETPTDGFCNGIFPSGAAIQLESNDGYAGGMSLNIVGGTFTSEQGYAFYEYLAKFADESKNTKETSVKSLSIDGVKFVSAKDSFEVSEDLATKVTKFVKGGIFSSDVTPYIADGTVCKASGENFVVLKQSSIVAVASENGLVQLPESVTNNNGNAVAGDIIGLMFLPKDGFEFSKVTVKDAYGNEIEVNEDYEFVMPDSSVTVEAIFTEIVSDDENKDEEVKDLETNAPVVDTTEEVEKVVLGVSDLEKVEQVLLESLEADEELSAIAKEYNATLAVEVSEITLTEEEKAELEKALSENDSKVALAKLFDISIVLRDKETGDKLGNLSELKNDIEFVVAIPAELQNAPEGFERTFYVVREHTGEVKFLPTTVSEDGKFITFESSLFSEYALIYVDVETSGESGSGEAGKEEEPDKDDVNKEEGKEEDTNKDDANKEEDANKDDVNKEENKDVPTTGDIVLEVSIALAVISLAGIVFFVKNSKKNRK